MPNSDLWLVLWRTLVTRGTAGARLKQTKGHALDPKHRDYLQKHPELRVEARHNNIADGVADRAREHFFHPNMRKLSTLLCKRHDGYVLLVRAIMAIIRRVHIVAQELRTAQSRIEQHPDRPLPGSVGFVPPWEDDTFTYTPLSLKCSQSMLSHHVTLQPMIIASFVNFLTCSRFAMTTHVSGITWLELFFLSVAMSSNPWALLHASSAHAQPTIAKQLREFATAATTT